MEESESVSGVSSYHDRVSETKRGSESESGTRNPKRRSDESASYESDASSSESGGRRNPSAGTGVNDGGG